MLSDEPKITTNFPEKISVGIPTYNRADSLNRTLDCILNQSYKNLEIIISDNCSTDNKVEEIILSYASKDPRIVVCFQQENIGMMRNFNFVAKKATGSFFMWKADDDIIEDKDFILKLHTKLKEADSDFAFPECFYQNDDGSKTSALNKIYSKCLTKFDYLKGCITFSGLEFYGLYNLNKFNRDFELKVKEDIVCPDVLYIPYLFLNHKVIFVSDTHYIFVHEPSTDGFQINLNLFKDRQIVMRDLITTFAATELIAPGERKEIVTIILRYYESILNQKYSIPKLKQAEIDIKNKIKKLLRIGKT